MSASKGKISSFFKRNKKQIEDLANDEGVKELISEVKGVKPEDVAKTLGDTAAKLDELAKKEEADGSVSTAVVGFLSKGDKKESKSAKIKSQIVSLAIKNWRYSIPLLMALSTWVMSWAWLVPILVPLYYQVKKRLPAKKTT